MPRKLTTENDVKKLVKEWFDSVGAWHYAPIQHGLGVHGIHDRIGCMPITITPEMVGKRVGLFVSVEAKKPGRRKEPNRGLSKHQQLVMDAIYGAYGRTVVCDSIEDLERLTSSIWFRGAPNG